ncbi:hypothetical protein PISMIDRAFT_98480 [Pisolithus microcarpus 441]|uniref:Unplaced genomic scaffold scaffold_32, whole genome shotgun sequence n=1 Tax=Pisolithus microcarpus 441 TaxID=765257 RepID=A0A0C9ZQA5_9AGAM|nr:hypothetical protein PISMIDRAFT_98480 [Pisolithus microcarpus 441]
MSANPFDKLSPAEQAEYRRRFPRAGWWIGALPPPPDLALRYQPDLSVQCLQQAPPAMAAPHHLMGPGIPPQPNHPLSPATYYRREFAPAPPLQVSQARAEQATPITHLDFSVPQNTGVVGAVVTRSNLRLPCDISFVDFWDRLCAHMDLDPTEAVIGYKFSTDRVGDALRSLANENDLRVAIDHGQGLVHRARTCKIEVVIHNLVCMSLELINLEFHNNSVAESRHQGSSKHEELEA